MAVSQVFTTTGAQTWNWPAGVTTVDAEALGGGGGSGTASGNPATGGGGKGGSYAKATITKGAETLLNITVGTGGAIAGAGAASTVVQSGTTRVSAAGGGGGATQASSSANGAGGSTLNGANTGTVTFAGGNGGTGNFTSGTQGSGAGGGAAGPTSVGGAASVNTAGTVGTGTWGNGNTYQVAGRAGVGNTTPGVAGITYGGAASGGKANTGADQNGAVGAQGIVVLTWTPPDQAVTGVFIASTGTRNVPGVSQALLVMVNGTGKVRVASAASMALTISPAPAVGNGIVLPVVGYNASGMTFTDTDVTDNKGNVWKLVFFRRITANGEYAVACYVCPKIAVSGGTFTITVQPAASTYYFVGSASEIGGLVGKDLVVADFLTASGSGTAVATGNTGSLSVEVLEVSVMVKFQTATSITVEAVVPTWSQEFEELDGTNWIASEGDTRITTLSSTPASSSWTIAPTGNWAAGVAAFKGVVEQAATGNTIASTVVLRVPTVALIQSITTGRINATTVVGETLLVDAYATNLISQSVRNLTAPGYGYAQSIFGVNGVLSSVVVGLLKQGSPTDNVYVEIHSGTLHGTLLATSQLVPCASLTTALDPYDRTTPVRFSFATPPTLVGGTTYYIEVYLTRSSTDASNFVSIWTGNATTGSSYSGGSAVDAGGTSQSYDVLFNLYADARPSVALAAGGAQGVTTQPIASTATLYAPTKAPPSGPVGSVWAVNSWGTTVWTENSWATASTDQAVTTVIIAGSGSLLLEGSSGDWLLETGAQLLLEQPVGVAQAFAPTVGLELGVTGQTVASTLIVRAPTVAVGPVAVTTATLASTAILRVPTVAPGPVTLTGATIGTTRQLFAPTVTTLTFVTTGTRLSLAVMNAPTVAAGPVAVSLPTIAATSVVTAPVVAPGTVTLSGATVASTRQLFAPTVAVTVALQSIASTVLVFALTVAAGPVSVTAATIGSTAILRTATVAPGPVGVTGSTIATTAQVFAPTLAVGPVTVTTATIASTVAVNAPTAIGLLSGAFITSGSGVFPPSVALTLTTSTRPTTLVLNAPSVALTIVGATRPTTLVVFAPTIDTGPVTVTGATLASTALLRVPTLAVGPVTITTGTRAAAAVLNPATVTTLTFVTGSTIASGNARFAPSVALTVVTTPIPVSSAGVVLDTFNRADGLLTTGAWATAGVWFGLPLRISSQQVKTDVQPYGEAYYTPAFPVDFRASITVPVLPTVDGDEIDLGMFDTPTSALTNGFNLRISLSGGVWRMALDRYTGGSAVNVGTTPTIAIAAGGAFGFERIGTTIRTWYRTAAGTWIKVHDMGGQSAHLVPLYGTLGITGSAVARIDDFVDVNFSATGGAVLFAPTVTLTVLVPFQGSTAQVFAATIATGPVSVTAGTLTSTVQAFAPTIAAGPVSITTGTRTTLLQLFAPTVAPGPVTIIGQFIASTAAVFQPALTAIAAGDVGAGTIPSTAVVRAPSVVGGLATILPPVIASTVTVTAPSVAVGPVTVLGVILSPTLQVFAPTVTVGPVTVLGATRPSTVQLFAPTLTQTVTGGTVGSTVILRAPTVSVGPVAVTLPFIGSTTVLTAPALAVGPVAVTTATLASTTVLFTPSLGAGAASVALPVIGTTSQVFAPSLRYAALGATIAPTSVALAPSVAYVVAAPTLASGSLVFAPALAAGVTTGTRLSFAQVFAPSVAPQAVTITTPPWGAARTVLNAPLVSTGATLILLPVKATTTTLFPPTVAPGAVAVTTGTRLSFAQVFAPSVAPGPVTVVLAHRPSTLQMFAPSLTATGAVQPVGGQCIGSTVALFAPSVGVQFVGATIPSGNVPHAPELAYVVWGATLGSVTVLAPPRVSLDVEVETSPITSTCLLFPPSLRVSLPVPPGACLSACVYVRYLATAAAINCTPLVVGQVGHQSLVQASVRCDVMVVRASVRATQLVTATVVQRCCEDLCSSNNESS